MLDDSTGKAKFHEGQQRAKTLTFSFIFGLCLGVIVSERIYVATNKPAAATTTEAASTSANLAKPSKISKQGVMMKQEAGATFTGDPKLLSYLQKIAPTREVMIAVSNKNLLFEGMLDVFIKGVQRAKVSNFLVLALDKETEQAMIQKKVNVYFMDITISKQQAETGSNHAVSSLKFGILKQFLEAGWAVLLSDVDIAVLQNPFEHLYRDSDVEGMSDGFDEAGAYGRIDSFDDPSMGWARFAQSFTHFNLNSGLFYVQANTRTIDMMTRLRDRLAKEKYWDQTAYNEAMFVFSHNEYKSPQVTVRVMDIYTFMNSKVLFKNIRLRPKQDRPGMPVMVHINYHPDKLDRMKAVFKFYLENDENALKRFPGGSEPGT